MQVTLKQSEIEIALKNYIQVMGINLSGKSIEVTFTAGRKEAGISAELDINETGQPQVGYVTTRFVAETPAPIVAGIATSQELRPAQDFRPSLVSRAVAEVNPVLAEVHAANNEGDEPESPVVEEAAEAAAPVVPKVNLFG